MGARAVGGDGEVANDAEVAGDGDADRWRCAPDGASAGTVSVLAWSGRRQASAASYGVINKARPNSAALSLAAVSLAPKDQRNLPAVPRSLPLHARARGAIERCQPTDPPMRRCDDRGARLLADVDAPDSFFATFRSRGPTMELERSAALLRWRTMLRSTAMWVDGAVSVLAWSGRRQGRAPRATGSSTKRGQILQHCHCALGLARSERSAEFARGAPAASPSRARARRHRAVPADRPAGDDRSSGGGCWPTATRRILEFLFRDFRIGANDGARAVSGDAEVANDAEVDGDAVDGAVSVLAWSGRRQASAASYGVINKARPNSAALSLCAWSRSLRKISGICPRCPCCFPFHARARGAIERSPADRPACWPTATRRIPFSRFPDRGQRWSSSGQRRC